MKLAFMKRAAQRKEIKAEGRDAGEERNGEGKDTGNNTNGKELEVSEETIAAKGETEEN